MIHNCSTSYEGIWWVLRSIIEALDAVGHSFA